MTDRGILDSKVGAYYWKGYTLAALQDLLSTVRSPDLKKTQKLKIVMNSLEKLEEKALNPTEDMKERDI